MRLLGLLIALVCVSSAFAEFSEKEMVNIVSSFNKIRAQVSPRTLGDFNQLSWDNILFNNAFNQAQSCQRDSLYSSNGAAGLYGESFAYFSKDPGVNELQDQLANPRQYYNYDDTECLGFNDCTPYTNIIWNSTTQVGCSKNLCGDRYLVVCNFNPPGSYSGVVPYEARQHASRSVMDYSDRTRLVNLDQRIARRDDDHVYTANVPTEGSFDWREKGVVGYPKDSINCASGWAFTAVGIYESRVAMRTKNRYDLSDQQVIDCINFSNYSISNYSKCNRDSGDLNKALLYIQQYGVESNEAYPYVGNTPNQCFYNQTAISAQGGDIEFSQIGRDSIVEKTRSQGPTGVGIFVTNEFLNYAGGIFFCNNSLLNQNINHNVLLVGFNEQQNYYIIKNNFGRSWGENGFARISADADSDCLIAKNPAYSVQI